MSFKKATRISAIVFLSSLGIGTLLLLFYANTWAEKKLQHVLARMEKTSLKTSYGHLDINLFSGELSISEVSISHKQGKNQYRFTFDTLEINGLGIVSYLFHNQLSFEEVTMKRPRITYILNAASPDKRKPRTLQMPQLKIRSLQIDSGSFAVKQKGINEIHDLASGQFNISVKEVHANATSGPHLDWGLFQVSLSNITYEPGKELYKIAVKSMHYNSRERVLALDSLHIKSKYKKYELANVVNHEIDWMKVSIPTVKATGVNAQKILHNKVYHADRITIGDADMLIFRDKRLPFPEKPDTRLLHESLADLQFKFSIDTIQLKRAHIEYQEFAKHGVKPGKINFRGLHASMHNLTNIDSIQRQNNYTALLDAEAKVMGKALLQASFTFPLVPDKLPATVKGKLEPLDMAVFNPMCEFASSIMFEKGRLLHLSFKFNYNKKQSDGEMLFEYDDLKVSMLNKKSNDTTGLGQDIKSFITNRLIIETDNLKTEDDFRVGEISFEKNKKKSIFNYWWKSLFSGFQSSTGLKMEE